jgi:putative toxin-antitoxin system antitoxin component (TIGR02293 family)
MPSSPASKWTVREGSIVTLDEDGGDMARHRAALAGFPSALLGTLITSSSIPQRELADLLGVSPRTLSRLRRTDDRRLAHLESSQLMLLQRTLDEAAALLGSAAEAESWLLEKSPQLDGERPIDLLKSFDGATILNDYLGRLRYGAYS